MGADFGKLERKPEVADLWEAPVAWGPYIITALKVRFPFCRPEGPVFTAAGLNGMTVLGCPVVESIYCVLLRRVLTSYRWILMQAQHLYIKDVHYLVKGTVAVIIDESTGRAAAQARWIDGIHQARLDCSLRYCVDE